MAQRHTLVRGDEGFPRPVLAFLAAYAAGAWLFYATLVGEQSNHLALTRVMWPLALSGLATLTATMAVITGALAGSSIRCLLLLTAVTLSLLVTVFSLLYWTYGTSENFSQCLSKWDAVYFALGTLTTAGTGNLMAISDLAKALASVQLVVDLVFMGGAVALVVARLGARADN